MAWEYIHFFHFLLLHCVGAALRITAHQKSSEFTHCVLSYDRYPDISAFDEGTGSAAPKLHSRWGRRRPKVWPAPVVVLRWLLLRHLLVKIVHRQVCSRGDAVQLALLMGWRWRARCVGTEAVDARKFAADADNLVAGAAEKPAKTKP